MYTLTRISQFSGTRKIGIDSDILINILDSPFLFSDILTQFQEGVLYIHLRNYEEVSSKRDTKELNDFMKKYKIGVVPPTHKDNPFLQMLGEECKKAKIPIPHIPDRWIIADFKMFGINTVYSGNRHFREGCRLLGMDAIEKVPSINGAIRKKLKDLF